MLGPSAVRRAQARQRRLGRVARPGSQELGHEPRNSAMDKCLGFSRERDQEGGALIFSPGLFTPAPHSCGRGSEKAIEEKQMENMSILLRGGH